MDKILGAWLPLDENRRIVEGTTNYFGSVEWCQTKGNAVKTSHKTQCSVVGLLRSFLSIAFCGIISSSSSSF
jgi:hypothetical protein